jgi:hypothetical protein
MIFFLLFVSASYASFSESEHSDDDQELFNLDDIEAIQEAHRRSISKFLHMPAPGTSDQSDDMIPTPTLMAPASIAKASDEETQFSSSSSSSSQSPPLPSSSSSSQIGALWPPTQQTVQSTNIAEMTDEDIEILARRATEHHRTQMFSNFEVSEMTDEAMTNLAQQNAHPLEGYPFQYMGVPEGTYVDFYMFQPPQYMQPWHFEDTSPGRHTTRGYSSRQTRRTHEDRLSSGSNQERPTYEDVGTWYIHNQGGECEFVLCVGAETGSSLIEMTTETRFYKSKVPREGNYTVITEITGRKVTFRVPKNDSKG